MADLLMREQTRRIFQSPDYSPDFDSPEALARWRTRGLPLQQRATEFHKLKAELDQLWTEVTGTPSINAAQGSLEASDDSSTTSTTRSRSKELTPAQKRQMKEAANAAWDKHLRDLHPAAPGVDD